MTIMIHKRLGVMNMTYRRLIMVYDYYLQYIQSDKHDNIRATDSE